MKKTIFTLIIAVSIFACEKKSKGEKLLEDIKKDTKEAVDEADEEIKDSKDEAGKGVKKSKKKLKELFK